MSKFDISVGVLPDSVSDFHGKARVGDPALIVKHPEGPWTTAPYTKRVVLADDRGVTEVYTYTIDGIRITVGVTTTKGSTDGKPWERPALAYAASGPIDFYAEGDGSPNTFPTSAFYLFPKHRRDTP